MRQSVLLAQCESLSFAESVSVQCSNVMTSSSHSKMVYHFFGASFNNSQVLIL